MFPDNFKNRVNKRKTWLCFCCALNIFFSPPWQKFENISINSNQRWQNSKNYCQILVNWRKQTNFLSVGKVVEVQNKRTTWLFLFCFFFLRQTWPSWRLRRRSSPREKRVMAAILENERVFFLWQLQFYQKKKKKRRKLVSWWVLQNFWIRPEIFITTIIYCLLLLLVFIFDNNICYTNGKFFFFLLFGQKK